MRITLVLPLALLCAGCANRVFTDLGNGTALPSEAISKYASDYGISRDQAREELRAHHELQRIHEYSEQYGVTLEEAQRQLEHAAAQNERESVRPEGPTDGRTHTGK